MQSYADITNVIASQIHQMSLDEQIKFLQHLIVAFTQDLPSDWLAGELDIEKPHFQALVEQITHQTWQADVIEQQLNELDNIMFGMGDDYPHTTSEVILLLLDLLGFYLSLMTAAEKSPLTDSWVILAAESYLDFTDKLMEQQSEADAEQSANFDNWLSHPITATAFKNIKNALDSTKNN